jgi:hypothetical protein
VKKSNEQNSKRFSEEQTEVAEGSESSRAFSVFRNATVRADVVSKRRRSPRRCSSLDGIDVSGEFLLQNKCEHSKHSAILTVTRLQSYRDADKSLARPGREQDTATEECEFHIF